MCKFGRMRIRSTLPGRITGPPGLSNANNVDISIVAGFLLIASIFQRLEPCAGKLACTVLRGLGTGNRPRLLDYYKSLAEEKFRWPRQGDEVVSLTGQQINWLLDGYDISLMTGHKKLHYDSVF